MSSQLRLYILASGSAGNATVVEGPEGSVLVDCGLSRKELRRRAELVDCDLARVCAILITHEHGDHTKGIPVVAKHFDGTIYATTGTMEARTALAPVAYEPLTSGDTISIGGMRVRCFSLSHDVEDPIAFRFDVCDGDELIDSVGWATDTGVLTDSALEILAGCRILGIETNHCPKMLANGPYPYYLKQRVGGSHGHLSNDQAVEALARLVTDRTETVVGMHISQENNRPSLARKVLEEAVGDRVEVRIAKQFDPIVVE